MKKYRYVEFIDGFWGATVKQGRLFIVVENPENYIEEFSLKDGGRGGYYTTLEHIAELGWELAFVTTCGNLSEGHGKMLQNAYIFKKEIQ